MAADITMSPAVSQADERSPLIDEAIEMPTFDPKIHLAFQTPSQRHSFSELGLPKPHNAPDLCYTDPFPLFSEEGVRMLRREALDKHLLDRYLRSWDRAPAYIAGHEKIASFMLQAWQHPATQAAIDKAAGFQMRPLNRAGDIGMVNVQLGPEGLAGVYKLTENPSAPLLPSEVKKSQYDNIPIDAWHKDQVPMVCVVMLSDTSTMEGGETAIKIGDGSIVKTKAPNMGGAVILQGGCTEHAALRATNAPERISMVTSYTFADPNLDDRYLTLRSVDPSNDDMPLMWNLFLQLKLVRLRDRLDLALTGLKEKENSGEMIERAEVEPWVKEQIEFLRHSAWEMFERVPNYLHKDVPEEVFQRYLSDAEHKN